jgi:hypothetical protein
MKLAFIAALAFASVMPDISSATSSSPTQGVAFKDDASSTGWIDFDFQDGKRIFIPAKINGHDTEVLLATGLPIPDIDKTFAASIGLPLTQASDGKGAAETPSELQIQIGNLILPNTPASVVDFDPLAKRIGHPLPLLLGDAAFGNLVMDIDFAHHRIAFRDPSSQIKPTDAVEIPLTRAENEHLVPVSIEGEPPAEFELGLGNSSEMLIYQPYYESHKLLENRKLSKRQAAGSGGFVVETVATLHRAKFAGVTLMNMPAAFIPTSIAGTTSIMISGDIGLPVLSRFRLVIDYPHDRLYATPYADAAQAPLPKDRLGLVLKKDDATFTVQFVAPNSPSQAAGFKVGDKITKIDGKQPTAWTEASIVDLKYGVNGSSLGFTMQDGNVRHVKLADYF